MYYSVASERQFLAFFKLQRFDVTRFNIECHGPNFGNPRRPLGGFAKFLIGQRFGKWAEIPIPNDRTGDWAISNPSASLDWQQFMSDMQVDFHDAQVKILRESCPDSQFITHNFMGLHNSLDYYDLAEKLDFVSWDNYPKLSPAIPYDASLAADVMRGLKKKNLLIMEQTAGPLGSSTFTRNPQPGELRKICYQQLADGAEGQIWFRWRTCTVGREQYWHGLLGHDGKAGRRYREAAQVAHECRKLAPYLKGTVLARSSSGIGGAVFVRDF